MLEILAVLVLGNGAASIADKKGHNGGLYKLLFIFLWFAGEIGLFLFALYGMEKAVGPAYGFAALGAIVGGIFGYVIPTCLPDRARGNWRKFDLDGNPIRYSRGPARKKKADRKRRPVRDEEDDIDDRPRRRPRRDEDEEDEAPRRRVRRDEDEEDEKPRRRPEPLEEVEEDEPPRRKPSSTRIRRADDDDPPPRRKPPRDR